MVEHGDTVALPPRCLHELVESTVDSQPDAAAVVFDGFSLTYRQLDDRAGGLATLLRSRGVEPDNRVAVCLPRGLDLPVALLGVLKAGAAYVPLDPTYPAGRLAFMLADSGARILLTTAELSASLPAYPGRTILLDREPLPPPGSKVAVHQDNLAYVMYTSGSTGQPKGVMISHRAIVNRLLWMQAEYRLAPDDRVLQKTPTSYDVSLWEFFWSLIAGVTLVSAAPDGHRDPAYLAELIRRERITTVHFVPSMLRSFLDEPSVTRCTGLRRVLCGGEELPVELRDRFVRLLGGAGVRLHNLYGPTEASVDVTYWDCSTGAAGPIPIGRPVWNTGLRILDGDLGSVARGELYLSGVQLSRGYLNRPGLTAERFLPDPFGEPGARMYRSGDVASVRADRAVEFHGRVDHQVKIRGVRIELGEIESTLVRHPSLRAAVVLAVADALGDNRLVAHVVSSDPAGVSAARLVEHLERTLPGHMIPTAFIEHEELPLTPSGKIDRAALSATLEREVASEFAAALGVDRVGPHDDFSAMGGHRLLFARLCSRLFRERGVDVPVERLGDGATVSTVVRVIEAYRSGGRDAAVAEAAEPDLHAEARVPADITPAGLPVADILRPRHILLTGVTGFLGAFLLRELLETTGATVHCLVRAGGRGRIEQTLRDFQIWDDSYGSRIVAEAGDLERPRLGLPADRFAALASTVDVIFHSGALVNFVYPYPALRAANVDGTREVLRLACTTRAKAVHHLSTVDVCAPGPDRVVSERDAPEVNPLAGGYVRSKWVAERMIGTIRDRGLPVVVYRPRTVLGHSLTGITHTTDFTCVLMKGCVQLGAGPGEDIPIDFMPVDYVSRALVSIAGRSSSFGRIFHLANPHPVSLPEMWAWVRDFGYPLDVLPYREWVARVADVGPDNALFPMLPLLGAAADTTTLRVSTANTDETLAGTGIQCPPIDRELGRKIIGYLVDIGFLAPAPVRA